LAVFGETASPGKFSRTFLPGRSLCADRARRVTKGAAHHSAESIPLTPRLVLGHQPLRAWLFPFFSGGTKSAAKSDGYSVPVRRRIAMKQGQTNVGKKEQRQINQVLTKAAQGDETKRKVVERNPGKQHRIKGRVKS
jgi:hypothetical protein